MPRRGAPHQQPCDIKWCRRPACKAYRRANGFYYRPAARAAARERSEVYINLTDEWLRKQYARVSSRVLRLGHRPTKMQRDTEDSGVGRCKRCGMLIALDHEEQFIYYPKGECHGKRAEGHS